MASLISEVEFLREEVAQLNVKLDDVSEKIESELSKSENLQNQSLLNRYLSKEGRLLAEKDELMKVRGRILLSLADGREERPVVAEEKRVLDGEKVMKKEDEAVEEEGEPIKEEGEEEVEKEEEESFMEQEEGVDDPSPGVMDSCHPHTLLHEVLSGYRACDICKASMTFPNTAFTCKPCDFDAHGSCLTADLRLPRKLTDARHPHALILLPKTRTGDLRGHYECSECGEVGRTWVYECGTEMCGYKMHPDCVRVQIQAHVGFGHWMTLSYADPKTACDAPSCPHPSRGGNPTIFKCCLDEWKSSSCDAHVHPACIKNKTSPYDETKARDTNAAVKEGREKMRASMEAAEEARVRRRNQELAHAQKLREEAMNISEKRTADTLRNIQNNFLLQHLGGQPLGGW